MAERLVPSKLSLTLLTLSFLVLIIVSWFLPDILSMAGLGMKDEWPFAAKAIVQITIGSWAATAISSIARVVVWLRATLVVTLPGGYKKETEQVKMIHNLFLWILGVMTALSGYITLWFSGGE